MVHSFATWGAVDRVTYIFFFFRQVAFKMLVTSFVSHAPILSDHFGMQYFSDYRRNYTQNAIYGRPFSRSSTDQLFGFAGSSATSFPLISVPSVNFVGNLFSFHFHCFFMDTLLYNTSQISTNFPT